MRKKWKWKPLDNLNTRTIKEEFSEAAVEPIKHSPEAKFQEKEQRVFC